MKFRVDFSSGEATIVKAFSGMHAIRQAIRELKPRDSKARATPVCDSCEKEFDPSQGTFHIKKVINGPVLGLGAARFKRKTCHELACAVKALEKLHEDTQFISIATFSLSNATYPITANVTVTPALKIPIPISTNGTFMPDVFAGRYPCDFPKCQAAKVAFRSYSDLKEHKRSEHSY